MNLENTAPARALVVSLNLSWLFTSPICATGLWSIINRQASLGGSGPYTDPGSLNMEIHCLGSSALKGRRSWALYIPGQSQTLPVKNPGSFVPAKPDTISDRSGRYLDGQ